MESAKTYGSSAMSNTTGKVITCKAAVAWEPGKPLVIEEIQVDPPQAMEVRIKITHTSLCHTDITFSSIPDDDLYPRIFGHEAAGIVESVGEGITDIKAGDHVIPLYMGECERCKFCKSPKTNLCRDFRFDPRKLGMMIDSKSRFSVNGKPIHHFINTSTFSEYTVVEYACVLKIHPQIPLQKACLLGCGVTTGIGAAWNTANVEAGSTVAIYGLGTVGLAVRIKTKLCLCLLPRKIFICKLVGFGLMQVAEGARIRGASKIIGIDINPNKLAKSRVFGVTDFINPKDCEKPVHKVIKDLTDGGGVDFSFDCVGNAEVSTQAVMSTHEGWGFTVILGFDIALKPLNVSPADLFLGRRIASSVFGGFKGRSQLPRLIKMCIDKEVNVDEFITHVLPFSEINRAFELISQGDCLRCIIFM